MGPADRRYRSIAARRAPAARRAVSRFQRAAVEDWTQTSVTARRYARPVLLSSCVRLSVCHNPVLYRNDLTNRAGFCHERFLLPIPPHCRPIRRKLGYFRNLGFFPLACTLSQTPPPQVDGVVNETRRCRRRRRRSSLLTKHDNRRLVAVYYINSVTL